MTHNSTSSSSSNTAIMATTGMELTTAKIIISSNSSMGMAPEAKSITRKTLTMISTANHCKAILRVTLDKTNKGKDTVEDDSTTMVAAAVVDMVAAVGEGLEHINDNSNSMEMASHTIHRLTRVLCKS
jgi:hypothetical protein